jgi:hypothetical protein
MVLLHGIWMNAYRGWEENIYGPGFEFVKRMGWGGEIFNFVDVDGRCYGHVEVRPRRVGDVEIEPDLRIEQIGAATGADRVEGVLAVWTAPDPRRPGRTVVGWYDNATVFRRFQTPKGALKGRRMHDDQLCGYRVVAAAEDCVLLPSDRRKLTFPPKTVGQKGVPGQFNVYYPSNPKHGEAGHAIEERVRAFIAAHGSGAKRPPQRDKTPYLADIERRKQIEAAAFAAVWRYFDERGYELYDRQKDNLGYDLIARDGVETLCVEVKGRSVGDVAADFSRNEYEKIRCAEAGRFADGSYRICIVTDALRDPAVHHFAWWLDSAKGGGAWRALDGTSTLHLKAVEAARGTATPSDNA